MEVAGKRLRHGRGRLRARGIASSSSIVAQAVLTAGKRFLDVPPGRENWFVVALMFADATGARDRGQAGSSNSCMSYD